MSADVHDTIRSTRTPHAVDNTDWLKTAAIIPVSVDHFGHFFVEKNLWWSAFGRFAAIQLAGSELIALQS